MKYVWEWEMISKIYSVAENKCKMKREKCLWSSTSLLCPNVCANPKVQALTERMFLKKEFLINFQSHT